MFVVRPVSRLAPVLAAGVLLAVATVPTVTAPAVAAPTLPAAPAAPSAPAAAPTLTSVTVSVSSHYDDAPFDKKRTLKVPAGWSVEVWARRASPRLMAVAPDGRILVSRPAYGKVTRLTPHGSRRPTSKTILSGLRQPHGLAFDGSTLYVAESHRVSSYPYAKGKLGKRTTVLSGLPDAKSKDLGGRYAHALKSLAVGPNHELYVSVGSTGNISADDRSASPQRATVLVVAKGSHTASVFARGVRNGTGLAVAPDGALWTAVNNRDNIAYPHHDDWDGDGHDDYGKVMASYVKDHPLEPVARLTKGRDLGWPYCNPDPDQDRAYVDDVQLNADGSRLDCSTLVAPEQSLPAHSAPLGMAFTQKALPGLGSGALVGVHGSWNRKPPRAPEVSFFPYANGSLGDRETILTGFQNSSGSRWGRAVAAVQGADGAIYVSDDEADAIYRLAPPS